MTLRTSTVTSLSTGAAIASGRPEVVSLRVFSYEGNRGMVGEPEGDQKVATRAMLGKSLVKKAAT